MAEVRRMTVAQVADKLMSEEHADVVRESVAFMVGELIEAEVSAQIGASLGERHGLGDVRKQVDDWRAAEPQCRRRHSQLRSCMLWPCVYSIFDAFDCNHV